MHRLLKHYGFAFLVFVALACASFLAGSAAAPEAVPDYALRSEEVYRLEIGAAFFVAFYLVTMAVMLAFEGRGFAEFGTKGLRAGAVVDHRARNKRQQTQILQMRTSQHTERKLDELRVEMANLRKSVDSHQERLESLNPDR